VGSPGGNKTTAAVRVGIDPQMAIALQFPQLASVWATIWVKVLLKRYGLSRCLRHRKNVSVKSAWAGN